MYETTLMPKSPAAAALVFFFFSCTTDNTGIPKGRFDGYVPVYADPAGITQISLEASRPTASAGKIYATGNYIFQNELHKGIHIIDNSNRQQPKKTGFLHVPFSTEIAVKGNYLYTNNLDDLVVFDIRDMTNLKLVKRVEGVFPPVDQKYPPFSNVSFECADPSKGIVVRWERKMITDPKCRR